MLSHSLCSNFKLYKSTIIKYLDKCHMKDTITAFNRFVFKDRRLDHNSQQAEEGKIIEISNDFSDSSRSDKEPFEAQGVNVQSNSELTPTPSLLMSLLKSLLTVLEQ